MPPKNVKPGAILQESTAIDTAHVIEGCREVAIHIKPDINIAVLEQNLADIGREVEKSSAIPMDGAKSSDPDNDTLETQIGRYKNSIAPASGQEHEHARLMKGIDLEIVERLLAKGIREYQYYFAIKASIDGTRICGYRPSQSMNNYILSRKDIKPPEGLRKYLKRS